MAGAVRRRRAHRQRGLRPGHLRARHVVRPRRRGGDLRVAARWRSPERAAPPAARRVLAGTLARWPPPRSPVAGLFLGIVAAALWLRGRRAAALALGVPPVAVVAFSALFFPFAGQQPMGLDSTILPVAAGRPRRAPGPRVVAAGAAGGRRVRRRGAAGWIVPSPVGTNVTRLALLFGGVLLVAAACAPAARRAAHAGWAPRRSPPCWPSRSPTSSAWQVATAARDAITTAPPAAWAIDVEPLIDQLEGAGRGTGPGRGRAEHAATARRPRWRRTSTLPAGGTARPTPSATRSSTTTRPR